MILVGDIGGTNARFGLASKQRNNKYLIREFSKDSQFIIVTHNKRTMSSTDIIYGITMIEQGVSKVVPELRTAKAPGFVALFLPRRPSCSHHRRRT